MRIFHIDMIDSERVANDVYTRPTFPPPSKTYFKTLRICLCPPLHPNQPRPQQLSLRRYNDRSFHGNQKNGRSTVQPQRTGGVPRPCNCGPKSDGAAVGHIFHVAFCVFLVGLKFGKKPVLACIISKSMFETPWCSLFSLDVLRDLPKFTSVAVVTVRVNYENRTTILTIISFLHTPPTTNFVHDIKTTLWLYELVFLFTLRVTGVCTAQSTRPYQSSPVSRHYYV